MISLRWTLISLILVLMVMINQTICFPQEQGILPEPEDDQMYFEGQTQNNPSEKYNQLNYRRNPHKSNSDYYSNTRYYTFSSLHSSNFNQKRNSYSEDQVFMESVINTLFKSRAQNQSTIGIIISIIQVFYKQIIVILLIFAFNVYFLIKCLFRYSDNFNKKQVLQRKMNKYCKQQGYTNQQWILKLRKTKAYKQG